MVSMNRLSTEKRARIIGCLVEGNSIRATVRMTGAAKNTIVKLLADLVEACAEYQDARALRPPLQGGRGRRDLGLLLRQAEERPGAVQGTPGYGDVWTFTAPAPTRSSLRPGWSGADEIRRHLFSWKTWRAGWPAASSHQRTGTRCTN